MNIHTINIKFIKLITSILFLALFLVLSTFVAAQDDLKQLQNDLKEQEQKISQQQKEDVVRGNRGYIAPRYKAKAKAKAKETTIKPAVKPAVSAVGQKKSSKTTTTKVVKSSSRTNVSPRDKKDVAEKKGPVYVTVETQDEIDRLYRDAIGLFKQGKFEEAKADLERIIVLNPLHIPARRFIKKIVEMQIDFAAKDTTTMAKERMIDVDKAWFPPEKSIDNESKIRYQETKKSKQLLFIEDQAKRVIPEINFTDAHLRDVLKYLSSIITYFFSLCIVSSESNKTQESPFLNCQITSST